MVPEQHAPGPWLLLHARFHEQADVEAGALPGDVSHVVPVDLTTQALLIHGGGHRDHGVRVKVVHVLVGNEGVQGGVDRARARVQVEDAVAVEVVHQVFDGRLRPTGRFLQVARLHRAHPIHIERREAVAFHGAQVSPGALHPEHEDTLSRERIRLDELRRGVAAPGVGEGQVRTERVRAIDQAVEALEVADLLVTPEGLDMLHFGSGHSGSSVRGWARTGSRPPSVPRDETVPFPPLSLDACKKDT